jgi:hypothetical protein
LLLQKNNTTHIVSFPFSTSFTIKIVDCVFSHSDVMGKFKKQHNGHGQIREPPSLRFDSP